MYALFAGIMRTHSFGLESIFGSGDALECSHIAWISTDYENWKFSDFFKNANVTWPNSLDVAFVLNITKHYSAIKFQLRSA